jgi:hypothetical protein
MSLTSPTAGQPRRNVFDVPARAGPVASSPGTAAVPPASIFDAVTPAATLGATTAARHGVVRLPWRRVVRRLGAAAVVGGTLAAAVAVAFGPSDKPARGRAVDVGPPAVAPPHVSAPKAATKAPRHLPTPTGTPRRRERHGRAGRPRRSTRYAQSPRRRPAGPPDVAPARPAPAPVPDPALPAPARPPAPSSPPAPAAPVAPPPPAPPSDAPPTPRIPAPGPPAAKGGIPAPPAPAPVPPGAPPQFM